MRGSSRAADVSIFVITERKRPTGNKGAQRSATNVSIQLLGQNGGTETNTMDRGSSQRVTETSQGGNKKHIDWPCRSGAVNERRGRRSGVGWGERDSCRLGSREGNGERKWASIKLCQGQFAVNGPLHLAVGGPQSSACWDGGPVHSEDRDKSITIIIHITAPVLSC